MMMMLMVTSTITAPMDYILCTRPSPLSVPMTYIYPHKCHLYHNCDSEVQVLARLTQLVGGGVCTYSRACLPPHVGHSEPAPVLKSSRHVVLFDPQSAVNSLNQLPILGYELWDVWDFFIPVLASGKFRTNPTWYLLSRATFTVFHFSS